MPKRNLAHDLTGKQFGKWKVLRKAPPALKDSRWVCVCTGCGRESVNQSYDLRKGRTTRCRTCAGMDRKYKPGDRVGRRTVIEYVGRKHNAARVLVRCDCGTESVVSTSNLIMGKADGCRKCTPRRPRAPRLCQWCGRADGQVSFPPGLPSECRTCNRQATRRGRWPCRKPRAAGRMRRKHPNEHVCEQCEEWPR